MSESFKSTLASITGSNFTKALDAIGALRTYVSNSAKTEPMDDSDGEFTSYNGESILDKDKENISILLNATEGMGDIIANYEKYLDNKLVPSILEAIDANVYDEGSAIKAIYHYDTNWFINTPISTKAKSDVAAKLLSVCNHYYNYNMGLWVSLARADTSTLMAVTYKYNVGD